jgi:hypothetical protein
VRSGVPAVLDANAFYAACTTAEAMNEVATHDKLQHMLFEVY